MDDEKNTNQPTADRPTETDETEPAEAKPGSEAPAVVEPAVEPEQHLFVPEPLPPTQESISDEQPMEWTSADAPTHPKPSGWLAMLTGGAVLLAIVVYFLTRDMVSTASSAIAAVLLIMFNARRAHAVRYRLDRGGIVIGQKYYPYSQFRSFMVDVEGPASSIVLTPLQRFMPPLTVVCDHSIEGEVIGHVSDHLPMEQYKRDVVDTMLHKLHF
jgi:hypothetical protein